MTVTKFVSATRRGELEHTYFRGIFNKVLDGQETRMGIDGSDGRIQLQKLSDVDQVDKQQQQTQRGEVGAAREKAEAEREKRKSKPTETERQDKVMVQQSPHRKRKEQDREEEAKAKEEREAGEVSDTDDEPTEEIGGSLDIKG